MPPNTRAITRAVANQTSLPGSQVTGDVQTGPGLDITIP